MFGQSIVISEVTKDFQFFCKERHTTESLRTLINDLYTFLAQEHDAVPSLGYMQLQLTRYYNEWCVERYILRPDEIYPNDNFGNAETVRDLWNSFKIEAEDNLDEFISWYFDRDRLISVNQDLIPLFMNDLVYLLNFWNLRFHSYTTDYESNKYYLDNPGKYQKGVVDFEFNNPVCEVW